MISKVRVGKGAYIVVKGKKTLAIEGHSGLKLISNVFINLTKTFWLLSVSMRPRKFKLPTTWIYNQREMNLRREIPASRNPAVWCAPASNASGETSHGLPERHRISSEQVDMRTTRFPCDETFSSEISDGSICPTCTDEIFSGVILTNETYISETLASLIFSSSIPARFQFVTVGFKTNYGATFTSFVTDEFMAIESI